MKTRDSKSGPAPAAGGRRKFLNRLWLVLGGLLAAECAWLGGRIFRQRGQATGKRRKLIAAGRVGTFEVASVTAIGPGGFFLARLRDGAFLAMSRTCPHLGCSVTWEEKQNRFVCPCHGSVFNRRGEVESGPAPRPLDTYPLRLEDGVVKVEISSSRRREEFVPGQAVRPPGPAERQR